ncbi:MAG: hypothetical protein ACO1OB_11245 [Archangium sp.]
MPIERKRFISLWEKRDRTIYVGCARLDEPCRVDSNQPDTWCFKWGVEFSCYEVTEREGRTFVKRTATSDATATERWLFARLDPEFRDHDQTASKLAEDRALETEQPPQHPSSFWFNARAALQLLSTHMGLQLQGGYRHWFEHYFLLSVGGGYERSVVRSDGSGMALDSVLFTTRLEFATYDDHAVKRANLPAISAWVGMTGVLGVEPFTSWTTRTFVGVGSIIPISIELGYAVTFIDRGQQRGNFYLAIGLGF